MIKEARLLFWPWCVMTLAGLAPLIKLVLRDNKSGWPDDVGVLGFFGTAAFLTAFSFRRAQRTSPSTDLPEASGNRGIWAEKMAVLMIAVVSAGLIACLVQAALGTILWREFSIERAMEPVVLLVIIACSTGFWTLLTRSIVCGMLLTGAAQFVLYLLLVVFVRAIDRMAPAGTGAARLSHTPEVHSALSWFVAGVGLSYAAMMLWLGRRRFAKCSRVVAA
ncbi:MAG TPA: hypothetical protein VK615_07860 [Candidatus Binatia bacterium]|nr:hypothetical protein [Candidatus Binatia bacterium]